MASSLLYDSVRLGELSTTWLACLVVVLLFGAYISLRPQHHLMNLPGPSNHSYLLGSWGAVMDAEAMSLTTSWRDKYGDTFRFGGFWCEPRLYISDAAALNHIFKYPYRYPKQEVTRQRIGRVLGKGLVWAEGEDHRRQRRVMSGAFIRTRVREQYAVFQRVTGRLQAAIEKEMKYARSAIVNVNDIMSRATMDIILEAALDYPCNTLENGDLEIVEIYSGLTLLAHGSQSTIFKIVNEYTPRMPDWLRNIILRTPTARYKELRRRKAITQAFAEKLVHDKIAQVSGGVMPSDSLGIMLKANMVEQEKQKMSRAEVVEQVSTLIQAGHDTTAATLSWMLDVLAEQTEWQDKLRSEAKEFLEEHPEPSIEDYDNFSLLNAVIKECVRTRVTVPYVTRVAAQTDAIPLVTPVCGRNGKVIHEILVHKGTKIDGGLGDYNQSPLIWGADADKFDPNRFLRDGGPLVTDKTVDGTWGGGLITFLCGPRTCLGFRVAVLEMQMFLTMLVSTFKIEKGDENAKFFRPHAPVVQPVCNGSVQMPLRLTKLE